MRLESPPEGGAKYELGGLCRFSQLNHVLVRLLN